MNTFSRPKLSDRIRRDIDAASWVVDGVEALEQQLSTAQADLAETERRRRNLGEQLFEAHAEALEQARIVGMGGEREIALRQKLDIVSSLLREAAGRMSYGHWSSEFRARVEKSLKTKAPKP